MKKKQRDKLLFTIFMYLVTLVIFYPMIMMLLVSLKSKAEVVSNPVGVKMSFQFSNYTEAFREMNYPLAFRNSVTLTACSVLAVSFLGCIAAYAIVRCTKMKKLFLIINILFMIGLSLPQQVAIVPMVLWLQKLHLGNTLLGVIFVYIAANASYAIFLFSGFINTVPVALEEAARMDGATPFKVFRKIVFPLLKAPMVTMIIVMTLRVWNDFMYPLVLLQGKAARTLPLTIFMFKGDLQIEWNIMFAATTMAILPLMIVYFIFQKQIISGMMTGSVKM